MMGLSINRNVGSLNTVRNLSTMQRSIRRTMGRLSSGLRINCAADDPAGLVISEQMRAQIGSIAREIANLDGRINRNRTADSYLMQMQDRLIDMREIAVAAASTGYVDESMVEAYQTELNNCASEFNRIADTAAFGTKKLFSGSEGSVAKIEALERLDLSSPESVEQTIAAIDVKLTEIQKVQGEIGAATAHELASIRSSLEISHRNLSGSESAIRDADMAREQVNFVSQLLRLRVGIGVLAQGNLMARNVFGLLD